MPTAILINDVTKQEISRWDMSADERYLFYQACADRQLLIRDGVQYTYVSVAWKIPEQQCIIVAKVHGYEPSTYCDCD